VERDGLLGRKVECISINFTISASCINHFYVIITIVNKGLLLALDVPLYMMRQGPPWFLEGQWNFTRSICSTVP